MDYQIIGDSCCDLSEQMQQELGAQLVPLKITVEDRSFVDDENLNTRELIAAMKQSHRPARTSCPSPSDFLARFKKSSADFIVTLSSKLSGTYNSARNAVEMIRAEYPDKIAHVFDSKSACAGEVLVAMKLREYINQNFDPQKIIEKVEQFIDNMKTFFVLESLDNLVKNGRISKVTGTLASIMSLRPIMGADGHGEIALFERVRGTQKALSRLVDMIGEQCSNISERILVIAHCNNPARAQDFRRQVEAKYDFRQIQVVETRGLSTVYANDGGIVIAF
ncbi:DegV family protein [Feifania hominis]|uniref:DegV family protein n=1 Tax=Feifania hominis TaxID=2763660 RepID=A0A926HUA5_9FIRM|nr:DegV family protein [Feifania hominis]MBC8536103.1 DegV family protein [Feifania hominis]